MRDDYFALFRKGIAGEMDLHTLEEKLEYIAFYCDLSMVDGVLVSAFINGLLNDPGFETNQNAQQTFLYVLNRAHHAGPTHEGVIALLDRISPVPERARQLEILQRFALHGKRVLEMERVLTGDAPETLYPSLQEALKKNAADIVAASTLLRLDFLFCNNPEEWLDGFTCPKRLKDLWQSELYLHYAQRGLWKKALPLWETLPQERRNPYSAVYAADMYGLAGDAAAALSLYQAALAVDPRLSPVRHRIKELASPRRLRPELLHERKTAVCLYSWNKAAVLEQTLRSLAGTDTGNSPIFVLLNGCTDDSRERVRGVRPLFGDRPFAIIELPVNIGAPAARNWLIHLPEVLAADHVAFMDDDVILQKDWLIRFLTEMEADPNIASVGCKVVHPPVGEDAPELQYAYRSVSCALPGALKLSLAELNPNTRDTGLYSFSRKCLNVMGCLHLLRNSALKEVGGFDLRFSPSQVDDIDHDLCLCLKGYSVSYCGTVTCEHHQNSGVGRSKKLSYSALGSILGNDLKLNYKHYENLPRLRELASNMRRQSVENVE